MDPLTAFGVAAALVTLIALVFERRSHWSTLTCAVGSASAAAWAFLAGVWVIGVLGSVGYVAMMRRWMDRLEAEAAAEG